MYSIYKTRTTAIIVSAIHFVNWSISTRATCSRFKSIEKHWTRIEPLFIRIAALSNKREYRRVVESAQRDLTLMASHWPQTTNFPAGKMLFHSIYFYLANSYAFLTRRGILASRMLTTPSLYSLFFFICMKKN